jgi:hypothetical protein
MFRRSFGRNAALAAVALVACPVFAAIGRENPVAAGRPAKTCASSTKSVKQLAMIDNASDDSFQCLGVALEGDKVTAIHLETHRFVSAGRQPEVEQIKVEEFSKAVVESSRGAVLDGIPGHDAIILQGRLSTPPGKSELVTSYLYNGFTGEYRSCPITLDRAPKTGWRLADRFDQTISHIVVRTRQIPLIGTFGISTLEGACT